MKAILKKITTITTTASFALIPGVAILDLNAETGAQVEADASEEVRLLTQELDETVDTTVEDTEEEVDDALDTVDGVDEEGEETPEEEVTELGEEQNRLVLVRTDLIDAGVEVQEEDSLTDPTLVETEEDVEAFATTLLLTDENAKKIEIGESDVQLTYRTHARLFGFIPVLVSATATVTEDSEVEVSYPWYAFLSATNKEEIETEIAEQLQATVDTDAVVEDEETEEASPETEEEDGEESADDATEEETDSTEETADTGATAFTPMMQATMLAEMHAAMQASFESEEAEVEAGEESTTDIEIEAEG